MSLDPVWLLAELVVSGIGMVLLMYGRKQARIPHLIAGLVLLVYPYFVSGLAMLVAVGAIVIAGLWFMVRQGW
jgi:hypothetical protein